MKKLLYVLFFTSLLVFNSCSSDDDDIKLPDITIDFASSEVGIDEDKTSQDITINLSRKSDVAIDVTVTLSATGVTYNTDFVTDPITADNNIKINIPAGSTSASFRVSKVNGALFEGTENVKFQLSAISVTDGVKLGDKKEVTLTFGTILSQGDILTLDGKAGDVVYANSVYVDFSSNTQVAIDRKSWNLGFHSGSEFRVILNEAYATAATASTKTDITAVTIEDANAAIDIAASAMSAEGLSINAVDSFDGALSGTVFPEISANESENKVYFVASEGNKTSRDQWYKVKVNRKGNGYSVQYAKVGETTIKTVDISKNAAYNFSFLSLDNGSVVNVEPEAKKWDIMWSYYVGLTMNRPYFMQDMVLSNNIGGAEVVEVLTDADKKDEAYNNFKEADLASLKFSNARNTIGNNWRRTASMASDPGPIGVKKDRFYVVKDPNGSYYKLKFNKMGLNNDTGERGRPEIEYALVK